MTLLALLGVISSAIYSGTSLLYATLGEVVGERSGIVNLGLEGVLLVSASSGYAVTSLTGSPYVGVLVAILAGGLMNLLFGYLVISRKANQLASGLAMMFFGFGLSALIGAPFVGVKINSLPRILFPGLAGFSPRYTYQFQFDFLIYLVVPAALAVWFLLFRTRWGLGLRAVGESADTAFAAGDHAAFGIAMQPEEIHSQLGQLRQIRKVIVLVPPIRPFGKIVKGLNPSHFEKRLMSLIERWNRERDFCVGNDVSVQVEANSQLFGESVDTI